MNLSTVLRGAGLALVLSLGGQSTATLAEAPISETESHLYFVGLMEQAKTFRVAPDDAGDYLKGVWRLDEKAHYGPGHYVQAARGDGVYLICNETRLVQVDFNHAQREFIETVSTLSDMSVESEGSFKFKGGRQYIPLDNNHMAVAAYDYIAILERASGIAAAQQPPAVPD
ncbi:MAG: hypothetical protein AAFY69_05335 [Pseudomonadota bacterium]